jgi:hypothetical protein
MEEEIGGELAERPPCLGCYRNSNILIFKAFVKRQGQISVYYHLVHTKTDACRYASDITSWQQPGEVDGGGLS